VVSDWHHHRRKKRKDEPWISRHECEFRHHMKNTGSDTLSAVKVLDVLLTGLTYVSDNNSARAISSATSEDYIAFLGDTCYLKVINTISTCVSPNSNSRSSEVSCKLSGLENSTIGDN
jgi:uncharacterized repeat protein (TIGR01451 family)